MSAPKKPGNDLSALKARLAKRSAKAAPEPAAEPAAPEASAEEPAVAAEAPIAEAPAAEAPVESESYDAPADEPAASNESYEEPAAPSYEEPAAAYEPEPAPAPVAAASGADPFSDGGGGGFDPNAGILSDGGVDVAPRKSIGLTLVIVAASLGFGAGIGFLSAGIVDKGNRGESAKAKGAEMFQAVTQLKDARAKVAMRLEEVKKSVKTDPKTGAVKLGELLTTELGDAPRADAMFGWQLASLNPKSIDDVFRLYGEASGLRQDIGRLASYVNTRAELLKGSAGPRPYGVMTKKDDHTAGQLIELVAPVCGDLAAKTPCAGGKAKEAVGYLIRAAPGAAEVAVPADQITILAAAGPVYAYAIGDKPELNATIEYGRMVKKVEVRLADLNKLEKRALKALEKYQGSPTTGADSIQPDPDED